MLQTIKDLLFSLMDAVLSLWEFALSFFEDIAYLCKLVAQFVAGIPSYFGWLPADVLAIIVALFGIAVIYKVVGRE